MGKVETRETGLELPAHHHLNMEISKVRKELNAVDVTPTLGSGQKHALPLSEAKLTQAPTSLGIALLVDTRLSSRHLQGYKSPKS